MAASQQNYFRLDLIYSIENTIFLKQKKQYRSTVFIAIKCYSINFLVESQQLTNLA